MKRFFVDFPALVATLIPPHKQQPVRRAILQCLCSLPGIFAGFDAWRRWQSFLIGVNSQVKVLEGYLRVLFGEGIKILNYHDGLMGISLLSEEQTVPVGLSGENVLLPLPLLGEMTSGFVDTDFVVALPPGVDAEAVKREIENFKLADKKYKCN